jgi:two-component system OmpR family response regulator
MNGYEWHVHRREQNYRSTSGNFVKFSSSVNRLSEKIYSQQAVYTAYTPGMDGLDVLKALRAAKSQVPVIFLTALADVDDRVEGLVAGGDDYLVKPFAFSELLARITVVSRRPKGREESNLLQVHDLTLDLLTRTATRGKVKIELHAKEFAMLEILMRNSGKIVTKTMLLEQVWDFNFDPRTTVVETHISRLRAKIDKPFEVQLLHTTRNTGYSLHAPE